MTPQWVDVAPFPGMDVQVGLLLAVLDEGTNEWRKQLGEVPDEAVVWQPFPEGHSVGTLILHIADVEAYCIGEIGAGKPRTAEEKQALLSEETQQYAVRWPAPPARPLSWYLAEHDRVRARTRQTVSVLGGPQHAGTRPGTPDTEFTLRWLLSHVITHEAYHGGQRLLHQRRPDGVG